MDSFINVSYESAEESKKEPVLLYSIGEVAKEIGVESSTIRHWSNKYYDFLDVQFCNTHRRYTKLDIDKLKIIKKCLEKKMSHNEIINTLKETNFDIAIVEQRFLDAQQPLDIQLFASAIVVELENKIRNMEVNITENILNNIREQNQLLDISLDKQREDIAVTVDEILTEKLNDTMEELKETFKTSYVSKEEIESLKRKKSFFGWLKK